MQLYHYAGRADNCFVLAPSASLRAAAWYCGGRADDIEAWDIIRPAFGRSSVAAYFQDEGLLSLLRRLFGHLSARRRLQFFLLLLLIVASAVAEVVSLGAVLPFLAALTAPEQVFRYAFVADFLGRLGIDSADELLLPVSVAFAVAAIVAGAIRVALLWANTRLAYATGADLSIAVYRNTLYQPYRVHIARNSSEVVSGITRKVDMVVTGMILPVLVLMGSMVLLVAIAGALFLIDPVVAGIAMLGFGGSYVVVTLTARRRVQRDSERIAEKQGEIFKALQEGLNGIRDVLLNSTQERYSRIYRQADLPLRRAQGNVSFISQSPRYAMEALGMVLLAVLAYFAVTQPQGAAGALPTLGAVALGGQRLLPALQQAYAAWSSILGYRQTLWDTLVLLDQKLPAHAGTPLPPPMDFAEEVRFEKVRFAYDAEQPPVLDGVDLVFRKGEHIGIIGSTGSGKSTLINILMGLIEPDEGRMLVDGVPLQWPDVRAWQRNVSHVPQAIYLVDASFAENIALGEPREVLDMQRVEQAARQAQIADFIESRPGGYQAAVGENGVRLSGGQRQRLGIARALYKQASVLVFDEATSALDGVTEQSVMQAIDDLEGNLTVVLIAHRLTTLRNCDTIIELAVGRVVREADYAETMTHRSQPIA